MEYTYQSRQKLKEEMDKRWRLHNAVALLKLSQKQRELLPGHYSASRWNNPCFAARDRFFARR